MNTKNYDAIQKMIVRLNSILEVESLSARDDGDIVDAMRLLRKVLNRNEDTYESHAEEVRTE